MKERKSSRSGSQMASARSSAWLSWVVGSEVTWNRFIFVWKQFVQYVQRVTPHQAIILCVSQSSAIVKLLPLAKP